MKVSVLLVGNTADFILGGTQRFKSHTHTRTHARTHAHTHTHARARAHKHTHAHTHTHTHTHKRARPSTPAHSVTHTRIHTQSHARTHRHIRTQQASSLEQSSTQPRKSRKRNAAARNGGDPACDNSGKWLHTQSLILLCTL